MLDLENISLDEATKVRRRAYEAILQVKGNMLRAHELADHMHLFLTLHARPERSAARGEWQVLVGPAVTGVTVHRKKIVLREENTGFTIVCVYV